MLYSNHPWNYLRLKNNLMNSFFIVKVDLTVNEVKRFPGKQSLKVLPHLTLKLTLFRAYKQLGKQVQNNSVVKETLHASLLNFPSFLPFQLPCVMLHLILHYFLLTNYAWMLCEGFYLHTVLVSAFISEQKLVKWLIALGWSAPALFLILYGILRGFFSVDEDRVQ